MTPSDLPSLIESALAIGATGYSYADDEQAAALGLPAQTGGWGLLMFETSEGEHVMGAAERALVAALEEREGYLGDLQDRVRYWTVGWPPGPLDWVPTEPA
jgi:hypothetical protein